MKKRVLSLLLALAMCLSLSIPAFAAEMATNAISLAGFLYNTNGSFIDNNYDFSLAATVTEANGTVTLKNLRISSNDTAIAIPNQVTLHEVEDGVYVANSLGNDTSIILESNHSEYYIDVVIGETCIAFGGNRLQAISSHFLTTSESILIQEQGASITSTSADSLFTKSGNGLRIQAIWNPASDNRLALRINTVGYRAGEWISRIQITGGSVPSSYVIKSANPSGSTGNTDSNFASFLTYLIGFTSYSVFLPSFSAPNNASYINGNYFSFDISPYIPWNDMNYTTSTSSNGMLMYLFLDHNGATPTPAGTLKITEHVSGVGTTSVSLSF